MEGGGVVETFFQLGRADQRVVQGDGEKMGFSSQSIKSLSLFVK